ncbi:redoxin domain-containing protein [Micromonospora sp. C28SCA-DRY-2]|uniref:TlpA family protein disulfide reductase n=1 Tax=Micromonospora sp. C28SCA-DRY-2 TaxID=3059522 RepID=UPI002674F2B6|nr:redoxin domain-containing protein [Micromonospora sp. C28SCA-DRY-2]MDO3701853.1 redoxin domain-containing protein [Micromonospora sp. C28SCA-DRY-2]
MRTPRRSVRSGRSRRRTRRRAAGPLALLLAALVGVASCAAGADPVEPAAGTGGTAPSPSGPSAPPPTGSAAAAPVPDTLAFTARTLDGAAFSGAALAGRPVVLWFWAPWCATCASQAWTVAEVAPKYRDTVPVVGVAGLGEQRAMKDFVTEFELAGTPQLDDRAGALWRRFEVVEQSTFVIIDRSGRVVHQGFLDGEDLTRRVAALAG